ncbi:cell division protein FtsQ, partial [Streptomyces sp. DJ]
GRDRLVREAAAVAAGLPGQLRERTRTVVVRSYDGIELHLDGGRTVVWGSSHEGARKARALLALTKAAKDAERYDVSSPGTPAATGS